MRKRAIVRFLPILVLLVAAAFRYHGLNWDQGIGAHPDERYVVDVASRLSFAGELNPFDPAPDYAYGHLPLYVLAVAGAVVPRADLLIVGRFLSASFDLGTVALTLALGRRVYDRRVGVLSAAFVGLMVAHMQQARFYTVDTMLAFWVLSALLFAVQFVGNGRPVFAWLAGGAAGLAVATKGTAALLVIPLTAACLARRDAVRGACWHGGLAAIVVVLAVQPFAVLELPTFLRNLSREIAILRGAIDVPYTRQYRGTIPYVYAAVQQLRWGMGPCLGVVALAGLTYVVFRVVEWTPRATTWVLLAWVLPFTAFMGGVTVKFPRHMLPVLPILAIYAAYLVTALARWRSSLLPVISGLVLSSLLLPCVALAAMYREPHPWVIASEWFYQHAHDGARITVEAWDHPLPLRTEAYSVLELPIFDEESAEKWETVERALDEADYVVIASRRGYASLGRWEGRYGETARYYGDLFEGRLGFEPVACFGRYPHLGSIPLIDDPTAGLAFSLPELCRPDTEVVWPLGRLDESFVVYDHPQVIIFGRSD